VKKQTKSRRHTRRATRENSKRIIRSQTEGKSSAQDTADARSDLLRLVYKLEKLAREPDLKVSRFAFDALIVVFRQVLSWLNMNAVLADASLGSLSRHLSESDAWERYNRGEHIAAWSGLELARHYKQIKAELGSRSKHSVNRLRDLRLGFKTMGFNFAGNQWFKDEYERRTDYRPTGTMAVWVARKIEEFRRLKAARLYADRNPGIGHSLLRLENQIEAAVPARLRSPVLQGETALKQLDTLPPFRGSGTSDFEGWRKFVRHRLLTQTDFIKEFEMLFPHRRRKLGGVIAATLRYAWQAAHDGGVVILPGGVLRRP
jgi:hypothetical protein